MKRFILTYLTTYSNHVPRAKFKPKADLKHNNELRIHIEFITIYIETS